MISRSFNFASFKQEIWKLYYVISFLVGLTFFMVGHYWYQYDVSSLFFIITFSVISYSFYFRVNHAFWSLIELEAVSISLYLQFICLIAHFYSAQSIGMLFLATVPMLAALVNFNMHQFDRKDTDRFETIIFLGSFFIVGGVVANMSRVAEISSNDLLPFSVFVMWILSGSYFLWSSYMVGQKTFMIHLLKSGHRNENNGGDEKLFFHDLINQTHGLRLFLESYQIKGQDVEFDKLGLLISEIQILQDHLSLHFGKGHRNLESKKLEVSLGFSHLLLENLVQTYLPQNRIQVDYKWEDNVKDSFVWQSGVIQLHQFHRMVTNLIKNVAEYRTNQLMITVSLSEKFLVYQFENPLNVFEMNRDGLDNFLKNSILESQKKKVNGLGLTSVAELSERIGGEFDFFIKDGKWIALLKVPFTIPASINQKVA